MTDVNERAAQEKQMLTEAKGQGAGATLKVFAKLSGPGWLQSAITLGGGSLAGALFLGVIGGFGMLWVQLVAMILGVIMLCAISYVTLSTGESPFHGIRKHVNPVMAWGWAIASLLANMVWVLPQYSLAYGAITENLFPGMIKDPTADGAKYGVSLVILAITAAITSCYGSKGRGIKIYEGILKTLVALIVLSFMYIVFKMSVAGRISAGEIFMGFIPNLGLLTSPAPALQAVIDQMGNPVAQAFWTEQVLNAQRDRMVAAAGASVGINMTFLLPFSLLAKKWDKDFRGLAIFDLATGMVIPFVLATACVVIVSAATFHAQPYEGLLIEGDNGALVVNAESPKAGDYEKAMGKRNGYETLEGVEIDDAEKRIAAMLMPRSNGQLAASLSELTGSATVGQKVFGFGVMAMALSTISLLMLISGFVICEMFGFPHGGIHHKIGTFAGATGILWPLVWSGTSKAYLAVPVSVMGYVLLPIAYITFFMMMNSKRLLGENVPKGAARVTWNILMGLSVVITGAAAAWTGWNKKLPVGEGDPIALGKYAMIGFIIAAVISQIYMINKHKSEDS